MNPPADSELSAYCCSVDSENHDGHGESVGPSRNSDPNTGDHEGRKEIKSKNSESGERRCDKPLLQEGIDQSATALFKPITWNKKNLNVQPCRSHQGKSQPRSYPSLQFGTNDHELHNVGGNRQNYHFPFSSPSSSTGQVCGDRQTVQHFQWTQSISSNYNQSASKNSNHDLYQSSVLLVKHSLAPPFLPHDSQLFTMDNNGAFTTTTTPTNDTVVHIPVFRVRKRILMKRQRQGCCGYLNLCQACNRPDGFCAFLNCGGCMDREITTKYYPDGRVKSKTHSVHIPCFS